MQLGWGWFGDPGFKDLKRDCDRYFRPSAGHFRPRRPENILRSFNSKIQYDDNAFLRRRTLIVRFEDIALDELEMAEKVYDFVGLEMHPKVKHMILMNRKKREIEIERKRKRRAVRARVEDLNIFGKFGLYRGSHSIGVQLVY